MAYSRTRSNRFCRGSSHSDNALIAAFVTGEHGDAVIRAMGLTPAKFPDEPYNSMNDLPGIPEIYSDKKYRK